MFNKLKQLFSKKSVNSIAGNIVPIVRSVRYSPNVKPDLLRQTLVKNMLGELINYTTFREETQENGVILLTARLDVLNRDPILENTEGTGKC